MTTTTYEVNGMTCGHCVAAVSGELNQLEGLTNVSVDLDAGTVTVTVSTPISIEAVRAAVHEAGYELVA